MDGRRGSRAVLDDARQKVERALAAFDAGGDLAEAAHAVLDRRDDSTAREILRTALQKYRKLSG